MRERTIPPFNRNPVIVLTAGFALLSAQRPDRARSVLLQETLGPSAIPRVPAVTVFYDMAQRVWGLLAAVVSVLQRRLLRTGFGGSADTALVHAEAVESNEPVEATLPEPVPAAMPPDWEADLTRCLAEFEQVDQREAAGSYWMPHAPTKGGRIMTGSA